MYKDTNLTGSSLPERTLCLTFDDGPGQTTKPGPGPRTLEIAQYLSVQGVAATFFMVGKYVSDLPEIAPQVESLGHLVANHTYDHPDLPQCLNAQGDVATQVTRTDGLVRNWIDAPVVFVRPPYGDWSPAVADALNANLTASLSHIGPIYWDISCGDFSCWETGGDPADCARQYFDKIEETGRGIVLMHDSTSDMDVVKSRNRTYELIQILIPMLQQRGYKFARVDQIPDVAAEVARPLAIALRASNGFYISPQNGGGGEILVNGPAVGPWEPLVVEDLYVGKVALRAANGLYLSPQNGGGGPVLANGPRVGEWEPLDLISIGPKKVAFRTVTGHFLTRENAADGRLMATAHLSMNDWEVFDFSYQ